VVAPGWSPDWPQVVEMVLSKELHAITHQKKENLKTIVSNFGGVSIKLQTISLVHFLCVKSTSLGKILKLGYVHKQKLRYL
jgi:hypothetical protein